MFKQTGKATALYYHAAIENPHEMLLDNQMQLLLCVELAAHHHPQPKGGGKI